MPEALKDGKATKFLRDYGKAQRRTTFLREYGKARRMGYTQQEIADACGVTKAAVAQWESRTSYPSDNRVSHALVAVRNLIRRDAPTARIKDMKLLQDKIADMRQRGTTYTGLARWLSEQGYPVSPRTLALWMLPDDHAQHAEPQAPGRVIALLDSQ